MKSTHLICAVATALLTSFASVSAEQPSGDVALRFVAVADAYDAITQQLGREASDAVLSFDKRTNTLSLDGAHPAAAKVRELIGKLDQRPQVVQVVATIKRVIPATATAKAREEILARPTLVSPAGKPMTLSFDDGADGTIKVELLITTPAPAPAAEKR